MVTVRGRSIGPGAISACAISTCARGATFATKATLAAKPASTALSIGCNIFLQLVELFGCEVVTWCLIGYLLNALFCFMCQSIGLLKLSQDLRLQVIRRYSFNCSISAVLAIVEVLDIIGELNVFLGFCFSLTFT